MKNNIKVNTEEELSKINEIYDLIKKDSGKEEISEDIKKAVYDKYGPIEGWEEDIAVEARKEDEKDGNYGNFIIINPQNKVGEGPPKDEEFKYVEKEVKINIEENHFRKSASPTSPEEETKNATENNENKKQDDEDWKGVVPRGEILSNIADTLTINDFEMITYLGNGAYGKVNLVNWKI